MEGISLRVAAEGMGGELVLAGDPDVAVTGGVIDSREVEFGNLFFALSGEQTDGHRFVAAALGGGASAAVVERSWIRSAEPEKGPLVVVDAPDLAMGDLARFYRRRFDIPIVAITGSNGKTTTKDMAAAVLSTRYEVLATEGNLNTRLGVPMTLFRLTAAHDVAVIEMGISEHHGLTYLCEIADPTIGVITNIGPTHLEFLGSVEGVAQAKGELLEYLDESSMTILNFDDLYLPKERAKGRLLGFGIDEICQFRGERLVIDQGGCGCFSLQGRNFSLSIPGRHNVYNALAATAVGAALEVPLEDAAAALKTFAPTRLRSQLIRHNGIRLLNDSYNANPASMRAALTTLAELEPEPGCRRVAVLGDMLELGETEICAHQDLGRDAAAAGVDAVYAFGALAETVAAAATENGMPAGWVLAFDDKGLLTEALMSLLKPGDVVLVKGSRGVALEEVVELLGFMS